MSKIIDYDILNDLSEVDIDIISRNIDLNVMLEPIKQNLKHYARYTRMLGRMEKKSLLVQKNMPRIALELYHKQDNNFVKLFALSTMKLKNIFQKIIENDFNGKIIFEDLQNYSTEEYIILLAEIEKIPGNVVELELFILQAKLNGIAIPENIQAELYNEWQHYCNDKQISEDNQKEKEHLIKEQEATIKKQLKSQKQYYNNLLLEAAEIKKKLEQLIEEKKKLIIILEQEIYLHKEESKNLCLDNSNKAEKIEELNEKCNFLEKVNKELQKNLGEQKETYMKQIKKEWENTNFELMRDKKELDDLLFGKRNEIEELTEKKKELEVSLDSTQKQIDSYLSRMEEVIAPNIGRQPNQHEHELIGMSNLYIANGKRENDAEICKTFYDFQNIVESNLDNIGCKIKSSVLGDSFYASINAGLAPLLCGFGARKVAFSLIAARYAEKPTIICIPNGFSCIQQLEEAIKNAPTISVVIEDLFGKMTENIILPIIRNSNEKQLIFCCEDANNLKYLDSYYYNYFQLILVNVISNKNTWNLIFGDADDVFPHIDYDNKTIGHKLVRYLLSEVGVADIYIMSRGNMLTYMIEEMEYNEEEALHVWMEQELSQVLSKEQKAKVIEIIENNEIKFGRNILEGF